MPITINKKSLQLQKRKEELEFELDVIEKNIMRVGNKIKEGGIGGSQSQPGLF